MRLCIWWGHKNDNYDVFKLIFWCCEKVKRHKNEMKFLKEQINGFNKINPQINDEYALVQWHNLEIRVKNITLIIKIG